MVDQMKTELRARKSRPPTSLSNSPCEGGVDATSKKMSRSLLLMERTGWSLTSQFCERPPRLRRFGGFATFSYWRSHPSFARRGLFA